MKKKIGLAALLGILAAAAFAPSAFAQCGTGHFLKFDADCFAYESNYTPATFNSALGSQLNVVGKAVYFCSPFADLIPSATTEYTFLWTGLVSGGTSVLPGGIQTKYTTNYAGGTFAIYEGTGAANNAPDHTAMPINPPNVPVPANFIDGTLLLNGTLANFQTIISQFNASGLATGTFRANYTFTGPLAGTYFNRVGPGASGLLAGNWNVLPSSLPAGYSAQPNGKFDNATTGGQSSTWGKIKQLYR